MAASSALMVLLMLPVGVEFTVLANAIDFVDEDDGWFCCEWPLWKS
jgi:hypothetical protein